MAVKKDVDETKTTNAAHEKAAATSEVLEQAAPAYSVEEYANAAGKVFDKPYSPDIVAGAFKMAGKKTATKEEAAEIMSRFLKKEVKLK